MNSEVTPSCIGGVDTLYYFADIIGENYNKIYNDMIVNETFFDNFSFLGVSGKSSGFVGYWFEYSVPVKHKFNGRSVSVKLFRVGFKDPNKQRNVKNVYIQLYAEGIYYYGFLDLLQYIDELFNFYGLSSDGYYVSRADINMFVAYDFSDVKKEMFKVPSLRCIINEKQEIEVSADTKSHTYYTAEKLETIYFGSRKSDLHFKIYNKFKEMNIKTFKYIIMNNYLKNNGFDNIEPLWNLEFSLKRKALLSYGVNTIDDLIKKAGNIFKDLMKKYVFLGYDVDKIERYRKSRNLSRLKPHPLWLYLIDAYDRYNAVPVKRNIKKYYSDVENFRLETIAKALEDLKSLGLSYMQSFNKALDLVDR